MIRRRGEGVPVGWLQLKTGGWRTFVAVAGIAIVVFLIFIQLALKGGMSTSVVRLYDQLVFDLVLINPNMPYLIRPNSFPGQRLYQSLAIDGVESVAGVSLSIGSWRNPIDGSPQSIFLVGIDPRDEVLEGMSPNRELLPLRIPGQILWDEGSRDQLGPVPALLKRDGLVRGELNGKEVEVRGTFRIGSSFGIDGISLASHSTFQRLAPRHDPSRAELGLIRLSPGADLERIKARLRASLPHDVLVLDRAELRKREQDYWDATTPIAAILAIGVVVGLLVGGVVVYQILYNSVCERIPEYATMKAIGFSNGQISWIVIRQAMLLALFGFALGAVMSIGGYRIVSDATDLPLTSSASRAFVVLGLTLVMSGAASILATNRVRAVAPTEALR